MLTLGLSINYFRPTLTHCFFNLLDEKGLLKRLYTQNIDGLDAVAGVDPDKLVECHGHFRSASCIACQTKYDAELCQSSMVEKGEAPSCGTCGGVVKPDITFFGEVMPQRFAELIHDDVATTDFLIVLGTSLLVAPGSSKEPSVCTRVSLFFSFSHFPLHSLLQLQIFQIGCQLLVLDYWSIEKLLGAFD